MLRFAKLLTIEYAAPNRMLPLSMLENGEWKWGSKKQWKTEDNEGRSVGNIFKSPSSCPVIVQKTQPVSSVRKIPWKKQGLGNRRM